ncbi:MAG: alkaline phosphatase [Oligoflexus sp.]
MAMKFSKYIQAINIIILLCLSACLANPPQKQNTTQVRNVILLIGDGMGPQQLSLAASYRKLAQKPAGGSRELHIEKLLRRGQTGLMLTFPYGSVVVDSAASATQIASAQMSRSEMIGLNADGHPAETILQKAKKAGKSTGLVSNTRLTHATPAAFAAQQMHRSMENQIAEDLLNGHVDVMLSGGYRYFLPASVNERASAAYQSYRSLLPSSQPVQSSRIDDIDLPQQAKKQGYELIFDRNALLSSQGKKILGLFGHTAMPDAIEEGLRVNESNRELPNLLEMSKKSIEVLAKNPEGFFLMIEAGQIDWAGHANDAGTMLHEILRFDEVIGMVMEWAEKRDDTLVIVTADHETGSFGFSYSRNNLPGPFQLKESGKTFQPNYNFGTFEVLDRIYAQKKSFTSIFNEFENLPSEQQTADVLAKLVNENVEFKITTEQAERILLEEDNPYYQADSKSMNLKRFPKIDDFREFYVYAQNSRTALLARQIAHEQQLVWGTGTHTATPVVVGAFGPPEAITPFNGLWHSTEISRKMMEALGLTPPERE